MRRSLLSTYVWRVHCGISAVGGVQMLKNTLVVDGGHPRVERTMVEVIGERPEHIVFDMQVP